MGWQLGIAVSKGAIPAPDWPLSPPVLFWDTRRWNGMTNGAVIPNLGSAGASFNLAVTESATQVLTASVSAGATWSTLLDDACGSKAPFTVMVCHEYRGRAGGSTPYTTTYNAVISWPGNYFNASSAKLGTTGTLFSGSVQSGEAVVDLALGGKVSNAMGSQFMDSDINKRFKTMTYNPVTFEGKVSSGPTDQVSTVTPGTCVLTPDPSTGSLNVFIRGNRGTVSMPYDGTGVLGMIMFRGVPTPAQIAFYQAMFSAPYSTEPFSYTMGSPYDTPGGSTFSIRRSWYDSTHCYHWLQAQPSSTVNTFYQAYLTPISGATLPSTIDFILAGAGEGAAGESGGANRRGGGAGGGQIVQVSGHTAPTSPSQFYFSPTFGTGHTTTFEGYTASGRTSGTSWPFIGPNGQVDKGATHTGGTGSLSPAGGGGGAGAGGNGGNSSGTTGGVAGAGIGSNWHWSGSTYYHGCGGPGGGTVVGARPQQPLGLGWGAQGTFVTGLAGRQSGGPSGLIVRYLRQY